ncbi:MAG: hypothetical protein WC718_17585 [Phycisphaerales bacterium]|jgi:hypothetical protein
MKRTRINPANRDRRKRLYERNYGDKADWIRAQPCEVTKADPENGWPIQAAHTKARGMGGCGGSKLDLVPLAPWVHRDFDLLTDARFLAKYERTKQSVKDAAPRYEAAWQEYQAREAA